MHIVTDEKQKAFTEFQKRAGVVFVAPELLQTAFTHRSYVNEANSVGAHNERMEFLGDAVLELVVTDHLFARYPEAHEGDLTSYRAGLVNAVFLSGIAEALGMNDCLLLSKGEARDTGRARDTILANTFEAVVGALYLDQGYDVVRDFLLSHVLIHTDDVVRGGTWRDAKSSFQEYAQATWGITPRYEVVRAEGPDHDKRFLVSVVVGERVVAEGEGTSKQEAEQNAAEKALKEKEQ